MATAVARDPASDPAQAKILDAASACVARWGFAKTTVDDIAAEAGCSRATIYRHFPSGKEGILVGVTLYQEGRFFLEVAPKLGACDNLEDALVLAISEGSRYLATNEVLGYLIRHEPEKILPFVVFDRVGPLLYRVASALGPYIENYVDEEQVRAIAEWGCRIVLSNWLKPSGHWRLDNADDARRLLNRYLLPGLPIQSLENHP